MSHTNIHVFINRTKYELSGPNQTGKALKEVAGIPLTDVLFLDQQGEDKVIANEAEVTLNNGDHLHSQPPANYGNDRRHGEVNRLPQSDGWTFVVYRDFRLPSEYRPDRVKLLVKLPPAFPDAQPDMFWVSPSVVVGSTGTSPAGTSVEVVLGEPWQRFSWHLEPGAWRPGVSDLRDYLRCVLGRFERRN